MKKHLFFVSILFTIFNSHAQCVTTFAGSGTGGLVNGTGISAQFNNPTGIAIDDIGNIYIADTNNNSIRKIIPSGSVSTLLSGYNLPGGVAIDASGSIYISVSGSNRILKVSQIGNPTVTLYFAGSGVAGFSEGNSTQALLNNPLGICLDPLGSLFIADSNNHRIRKTNSGSLWCGTLTGFAQGFADGATTTAQFNTPGSVAVDASGNVYVADRLNHRIRLISPSGIVTTLAGSGISGFMDGNGTAAKFNNPSGIAVDASGNVYVADKGNNRIRKITPNGLVTTIAGSGVAGYSDGFGINSKFNSPTSIIIDGSDNLYVTDSNNNRIRKISQLTAQISYLSSPFCKSISDGQPVTVTGTGFYAGGIFSSTVGLSINATTGAITPSTSTPGTYTITYTLPPSAGCVSSQTTTTVTILPLNTVTTPTTTPVLCINSILIPITFTTTGATGIGNVTGLPPGVTVTSEANTITISGAPTTLGTFDYTIPLTGGCGSVYAIGTIIVNPDITVTAPITTPTLCINTILTPITHTTTGATGIASTTTNYGLPSGVNASWAANTITISGAPTVSGTYNYSIPLTGGCSTVNATGTITVNPNNVSSASSYPTLCINTVLTPITHTTFGSSGNGITSNNLPPGVTATWIADTITISGTPTASGTFHYYIGLNGGCGSATGIITVIPSNTVTAASSSPTICVNSPITSITHTTTGATGIASTTTNYGLPSGVNASWAANTITISGAPTVSGTFNYSISLTGGCGNENATGTITVYNISPTFTQWAPVCQGEVVNLPPISTNSIIGIWNMISSTTNNITYEFTPTIGQCALNTTMTITVNPLPIVSLTDGYICVDAQGNPYQSYLLNTGLNNVDYIFQWFKNGVLLNATNAALNATSEGTYSVVVTNVITNCVSNVASAIVTSLYSPLSISADGTTATSVSINNGNTVQLQLNGFFGSPSNIQWTPNINISSTTISNPIVYPSTTTNYIASFINSNGCLQSTSITVNVNPLPNIGNISISTTNNPVVGLFDTITVNVQLTNATDLYSLYMKLKGNAAVSQYLDYSGYVASTLLGPLPDVIATNPIVTNGEYDFGITKIGAVPGYTGSGLFYTFKFVTKNIPIPDGTVFCFYLDDVNTYNSTGSACGLTNQGQYCFTFTNQIKVWPGDLNNSNVVTTADLLPIGYFYNSTGPVRPNATIQWSGQPATLWGYNHSFLNSNAYKTFADSNGDGVINNADQAAIGFNMNQVHARLASDKPFGIAPNTSNNAQVEGALNVIPNVSIINGAVLPQTVTFTVNLTNTGGLSSLYGISTNLIFDNTIFDLSTATIDYSGSIFGLVNTDCLAINYNSSNGVSVGLTRYANAPINGQGLLFKVTLQTKTTLPNLTQTQVTSYVDAANNQLGNPLEIGDSLPMNFSVINVNLGIQDTVLNTFKLYPNPTKGILYFSVGDSYLDFQELKLKIVNTLGQVIDQISVKNSTEEIITKNWGSSGLYFVQIETIQGEILGVKKIILQ